MRRRLDGARLLQAVTLFFALNMLGFAAAYFGISTSFTFFVWVSIFGVMITLSSGPLPPIRSTSRAASGSFPVIMMGANLGAWPGAKFAAVAVDALQPVGLMVVATAGARLDGRSNRQRGRRARGSRALSPEHGDKPAKLLGGIELVLRDRYLVLVALSSCC